MGIICDENSDNPGKYARMRVQASFIKTALRLRNAGMSYRRISAALLLMYNVNVSDVAILKWVKKYKRKTNPTP